MMPRIIQAFPVRGELVDSDDDTVASDALSVVIDHEDGPVADINSKGPRVIWLISGVAIPPAKKVYLTRQRRKCAMAVAYAIVGPFVTAKRKSRSGHVLWAKKKSAPSRCAQP